MLLQYDWEATSLARRAANAMQKQERLSGRLQTQDGQRSSTWLLSNPRPPVDSSEVETRVTVAAAILTRAAALGHPQHCFCTACRSFESPWALPQAAAAQDMQRPKNLPRRH